MILFLFSLFLFTRFFFVCIFDGRFLIVRPSVSIPFPLRNAPSSLLLFRLFKKMTVNLNTRHPSNCLEPKPKSTLSTLFYFLFSIKHFSSSFFLFSPHFSLSLYLSLTQKIIISKATAVRVGHDPLNKIKPPFSFLQIIFENEIFAACPLAQTTNKQAGIHTHRLCLPVPVCAMVGY